MELNVQLTLSLTSALDWVGGQHHSAAVLPLRCEGGRYVEYLPVVVPTSCANLEILRVSTYWNRQALTRAVQGEFYTVLPYNK